MCPWELTVGSGGGGERPAWAGCGNGRTPPLQEWVLATPPSWVLSPSLNAPGTHVDSGFPRWSWVVLSRRLGGPSLSGFSGGNECSCPTPTGRMKAAFAQACPELWGVDGVVVWRLAPAECAQGTLTMTVCFYSSCHILLISNFCPL